MEQGSDVLVALTVVGNVLWWGRACAALELQSCPTWCVVFMEQLSDVGCEQSKLVLDSKENGYLCGWCINN